MPHASDAAATAAFVEQVTGESHLRVEADLGDGFVRLCSSEAQRRQAAQDITCNEDILIELLRNARDAGASHIYCAYGRDGDKRTLTLIDDGEGIPETMHRLVFEPRVTSKLDTFHKDKWGVHGRGMALYSISVNAQEARVALSAPDRGTSIIVETESRRLPEKADQSTFPHFETTPEGTYAMRGPKNLLRNGAEFALEHRKHCQVYMGSATEIAATLYRHGRAHIPLTQRVFCPDRDQLDIVDRLGAISDPESFAQEAQRLGLSLSPRSARRIFDGEIGPVPSLIERIEHESFPQEEQTTKGPRSRKGRGRGSRNRRPVVHLQDNDIEELKRLVGEGFADIAQRYLLERDVEPSVRVEHDALHITIPLESTH